MDSRIGGPEVIQVAFSERVNPLTFNADRVLVTANSAQLVGRRIRFTTQLGLDGQIGRIVLLQPIPDRSYVCVTVQGVKDLGGNLMTPHPQRLNFWALVGDLTGDRLVDAADVAEMASLIGTNLIDPGNTLHLRADLDRSGAIDQADESILSTRVGNDLLGIPTSCLSPVPGLR